jgi:hypothetical protein
MAVERESQLVPMNRQLETLVWTNLEMIDGLPEPTSNVYW